MTPHTHTTYTPGCYRCELSRDEATPPIEPESEPLTKANVELIYEHTGERHLPACPFAIEYGQVSPNVCTCPHIVGVADSHDKLQATIDRLRRERDEANQEIARHHKDFQKWEDMADRASARALAAERTVREQREALESIVKFSTDPLAAATARATLAALPPVADERTEP